ncbi:GerAB/ArcD/ProY family transporter, partial [Bacillus altitudinis]|uniref:GerAB/ArcD/ProY family transporter n=1 Tax=Bacillus altitudinis TaxID=293387 RepID=UPI0023561BF1
MLPQLVQFFLLQSTPITLILIIFLLLPTYHLKTPIFPLLKILTYIYPITIIIYIPLILFTFKIFHFHYLPPLMPHAFKHFTNFFSQTFIQ